MHQYKSLFHNNYLCQLNILVVSLFCWVFSPSDTRLRLFSNCLECAGKNAGEGRREKEKRGVGGMVGTFASVSLHLLSGLEMFSKIGSRGSQAADLHW